VAQQILVQMREPFNLGAVSAGDLQATISTSIGIAYQRAGQATGAGDAGKADLLSQADAALYEAKAAGRDTYRLYAGVKPMTDQAASMN
jgi:GGDEF domain-containing protein